MYPCNVHFPSYVLSLTFYKNIFKQVCLFIILPSLILFGLGSNHHFFQQTLFHIMVLCCCHVLAEIGGKESKLTQHPAACYKLQW